MATGHAHKRSNGNKRKHGFTNRHTRQKTVTIPLVFQLLTFPARPHITTAQPTGISPLLHFALLLLGQGFGCGASEAPRVPQGGSSHSTLVPWGGRLSQKYPFTDANIILNEMWSSSVTQPCHTPAITPPTTTQPPALTHILNSKAESITPIFTINAEKAQKQGSKTRTCKGGKAPPQTSPWPDSQRKSKCKSHHPTPFFCPSVTQFTVPLIIQPLLHPHPLTTPFQWVHPLSPLS